jgi:hypothetical protein
MDAPVGTEVEFLLADDLWVPARIEAQQAPGSSSAVAVRYLVAGVLEATAQVAAADVQRLLCPAGTHVLPWLEGQPVDFLRRTEAQEGSPASQQWQRGERERKRA